MLRCRNLIKFMFPDISVHYEDITTRDNNTTPRVDLYVAGLVCQPLSRAGKGMGLSTSCARTWLACLGYIRKSAAQGTCDGECAPTC
ncbi:MAG: DNA cytosine methyltransferase, partial [Candidatus Fonsibacter sp.]